MQVIENVGSSMTHMSDRLQEYTDREADGYIAEKAKKQ